MDQRFEQLQHWLKTLDIDDYDIAPASADASFRRYFRVTAKSKPVQKNYEQYDSLIVMDAPPEKEDCKPFIAISAMLSNIGLNVPRVIAQDLEQGFILLTDLGNTVYLSQLNNETADDLYTAAMNALFIIQQQGQAQNLPLYDEALLSFECSLFKDWFIGKQLGISLGSEQGAVLEETVALLVSNALAQPQVCVHRDYHSRNLMINEQDPQRPGILDFQDAVSGPVTYDLVSLLKDCYISWPRQQVESWVAQYHQQLQNGDSLPGCDLATFMKWFDLMGVQRHLKAIGIFSRLKHRDSKTGYIKDIPRTLDYVIDVANRYPELSRFALFLEQLLKNVRI